MSYSSDPQANLDPTTNLPADNVSSHQPTTDTIIASNVPHKQVHQPVLHAEKLSKQVKSGERSLTILHDLSLSVAAGESVAILGKSGAGKSTLLGLLA
ncbi:MAG: ATP-binding cassette domain-containing protein, partial [Halomonas venusta]|nr:ATP-binding cassette domain-containing protein [Halomonas venusta]